MFRITRISFRSLDRPMSKVQAMMERLLHSGGARKQEKVQQPSPLPPSLPSRSPLPQHTPSLPQYTPSLPQYTPPRSCKHVRQRYSSTILDGMPRGARRNFGPTRTRIHCVTRQNLITTSNWGRHQSPVTASIVHLSSAVADVGSTIAGLAMSASCWLSSPASSSSSSFAAPAAASRSARAVCCRVSRLRARSC